MPDTPLAVVVLAAGEGTRMKSRALPKVLHGFAGRSLLGHVLASAEPLAAAHTIVVVGHRREEVTAHMGYKYPPGAVRRLDDSLLAIFGERYLGLHGNQHRADLLRSADGVCQEPEVDLVVVTPRVLGVVDECQDEGRRPGCALRDLEAELATVRAERARQYAAALKDGWTEGELSKLGFAKPGARARRRSPARQVADRAPVAAAQE